MKEMMTLLVYGQKINEKTPVVYAESLTTTSLEHRLQIRILFIIPFTGSKYSSLPIKGPVKNISGLVFFSSFS